jgi:tellurite resistance protein TerC
MPEFLLQDNVWLYSLFGAIVVVFLIVDLGVFQRKAHIMSTRSAFWQSVFWVAISMAFAVLIYFQRGPDDTLDFVSAYLMEKSLSVDNIFVFLLILIYFKVDTKYYHKVLYYGIVGAIIFRAIFIFVGIFLISHFHWVLYIFGAILIYTGVKMLQTDREKDFNPEGNPVYRLLNKYLRFSTQTEVSSLTVKEDGKRYFTILFLVVMLIETTDIVFALDSIPAVFSISQDPFIIYTSNIFAVMGLRAMFFLLIGVIRKFKYFQQGISFILMFIGVKMLLELFDFKLPTVISLAVILVMLSSSILLSVIFKAKDN